MRARLLPLVLAISAALVAAPAASAGVFEPHAASSATSGVVYGPDGNVWVVEEFSNSVARFKPDGTLVARYSVGSDPTSITNGPNGSVWVTVTGAKQLVWFDGLAAAPAAHTVDTSGVSGCGPVAIANGQNGKMYFSLPGGASGCGATPSRLGVVAADGAGAATQFSSSNPTSYSLAVYQGSLYAPDYDGARVLRITQASGSVTAIVTTTNMSPDGIAVDTSGQVWVTDNAIGTVVRYPAASNSGTTPTVLPVTGGKLAGSAGIVVAPDGNVYVAGYDSHNVVRFGTDLSTRVFPLPDAAAQPFALAAGPAGSIYVSDLHAPTYYRLVNGAPVLSGAAAGVFSTVITPAGAGVIAVNASGTVDPVGNDTTVVAEYGTTTDYGQSAVLPSVPAGTAPVAISGLIGGLSDATLYHVRLRATNAEGTVTSADIPVQTAALTHPPLLSPTPVAPVAKATLGASAFKTKGKTAGTTITVVTSPAPVAVTAKISLQTKGVQKNAKQSKATTCVAPPKRKVKGQKSCVRLVSKGTVNFGTVAAGTHTLPFPGKVGKKTLAPGKYTMVLSIGATTQTLIFTVKKS